MYDPESIQATVAHISDLHFGMKYQQPIWSSLATYLKNTLKPELILATGDLVDLPRKKYLQEAVNAIKCLGIRCLVCPGNHDRHWFGNSIGFLPTFGKFEGHFIDHMPGMKGETVPIANGKLRIVSVDTSDHARHFARGFVSEERRQEIIEAFSNEKTSEASLTILLVHHHLLPVSGLENESQRKRDLLDLVTVANAGKVLETLADAQVDLVLHGHEHHFNVARYGTFAGHQREVTIVGAPSATGARTNAGCCQKDASFVCLEFSRDGSIWLVRHQFHAEKSCALRPGSDLPRSTAWGRATDAPIRLFSAEALRRSRYHRLGAPKETQPSTVRVHFDFKEDRDIVVSRRQTNFEFDGGVVSVRASNDTGQPSHPEFWVKKDWTTDRVALQPRDDFQHVRGTKGTYVVYADLPDNGGKSYAEVSAQYVWVGASTLCTHDLDLIDETRRDQFKSDGREFVFVLSRKWISRLTLDVSLPEGFAPPCDSSSVLAYIQRKDDHQALPSPDLTELIHWDRGAHFSLAIDYPEEHVKYFLAWKVPSGPTFDSEAKQFGRFCFENAESLVDDIFGFLKGSFLDFVSEVAIYPTALDSAYPFFSSCFRTAKSETLLAPETLDLRDPRSLPAQAWWGKVAVGVSRQDHTAATTDDRSKGLQKGEAGAVLFSISGRLSGEAGLPWAIVRLSWRIWPAKTLTDQSLRSINSVSEALSVLLSASYLKHSYGGRNNGCILDETRQGGVGPHHEPS